MIFYIYVFAGIIAVIYGIFKFLEMRFIEKEARSLTLFVRDTLFVYVSVIVSNFAFEQLNGGSALQGGGSSADTNVFTNSPSF